MNTIAMADVLSDRARVLDVRGELPDRRPDLVSDSWTGLGAGEGFVLVDDCNPRMIYSRLTAEHGCDVEWDYVEYGPRVWRVWVGRPAR